MFVRKELKTKVHLYFNYLINFNQNFIIKKFDPSYFDVIKTHKLSFTSRRQSVDSTLQNQLPNETYLSLPFGSIRNSNLATNIYGL